MSDYDDYENNLAFKPIGDWADTEPKVNTDRTASTIELIDKIESLTSWVDIKSEYIAKLEQILWECRDAMNNDEYWVQCDLIKQIDELLGERANDN